MSTRPATLVAPPRLILFDLDGTFADTLPGLAASLDAALGEAGLPPVNRRSLRAIVSLGTRRIVAHGIGAAHGGVDEARIRARFLDYYATSAASDALLYPGIDAVLSGLAERGLGWGIVTNKLERFARPLVERLDTERRCACLVGGDTTVHPKPHPAPLLHACLEAGVAPCHAIYVGDARGDVTAGRRAGMRTVAAAYGYLADGTDVRAWGPSAVIETPVGLLDWLDAPAPASR